MKAYCALLILLSTLFLGFANQQGYEKQIAEAEEAYENRKFREAIAETASRVTKSTKV
jgi:hypothetical protein